MSATLRIGNQTAHGATRALDPWEYALAQGYDAFEWFSDQKRGVGWCEAQCDAAARQRLRETAAARGVRFSVHAPYDADPTSPDGAAAIRTSIDFGGDVGAAVVNVHLFTERGPRAFAQALRPLLDQAARRDVRISLENTPGTTPEDFNAAFAELLRLPEAVGGRVGMCLDMGHANLCAATRNDYLAFVDRLGDHVPIIHWHAHENWGDRDSHLPLFTGPSAGDVRGIRGLVRRLRARGLAGNVVLEQWPQPRELLTQARDRLRQLWEEAG
jgi:sugar phosphate isomerase/epimerase